MEKLYSFISLVLFLNTLKSVALATTLGTNRMFEIECNGGNYLSSRICLPLGYRKGEMPNTPVEIKTALTINHIREIDDKKMTVALEFHPVFVWIDNRIVANLTIEEQKYGVALNNIILNELWKPDLRVENIRSFQIHSILEDISGLAIGGSKNNIVVWYEFTAKAVIYCNFHFQRYPMDVQECNFTIGSTYPAKQAAVFTMNTSAFNFATVTQNTDAFDLDMINLRNEDNQTEFGFTIRMKRRLQPYIMECYIPSITIVLIAQVSFILSMESIPGRVGLLITLFLTLTNICIHQQASSPTSGSFTALGIYMLICLFFVTSAIMEFAFLLVLYANSKSKNERRSSSVKSTKEKVNLQHSTEFAKPTLNVELDKTGNVEYQLNNKSNEVQHGLKIDQSQLFLKEAKKIDRISLITFNALFVIFNFLYWAYYLNFIVL